MLLPATVDITATSVNQVMQLIETQHIFTIPTAMPAHVAVTVDDGECSPNRKRLR